MVVARHLERPKAWPGAYLGERERKRNQQGRGTPAELDQHGGALLLELERGDGIAPTPSVLFLYDTVDYFFQL